MSHLDIDIKLADVPAYSETVHTYPDRGPLSSILLAGKQGDGILFRLTTSSTTSADALDEAKAACAFAAWATEHADAVCAHSERLANELINELADSPADKLADKLADQLADSPATAPASV